jgi:uncharacterized phage protein (TIGR02218 family)
MKAVSAALQAHLALPLTTLATCWKITRVDATVLGFTDHDVDIVYGGVTYAAATGYTATDVGTTAGLEVDNLDVSGILTSPSITEDDLRAGKWDYAAYSIFMVNWADLTQNELFLRVGRLGEITVNRRTFSAQLNGLMQRYTTSIGEKTSAGCRAALGDARCTKNLAAFTVVGTISSVGTDGITLNDVGRLEPSPAVGESGYFEHGKITFTAGLNNGLSMEVKKYAIGVITLHLPMPYTVAPGDAYTLVAGCDRLITTCLNRFNNVAHFRGEPYLAGRDKVAQIGRHS